MNWLKKLFGIRGDQTSKSEDLHSTAVSATHHAADALAAAGLTEQAERLRSALGSGVDQGGYSGEYRLLATRTPAGGVSFWIRDAHKAEDSEFVTKLLVSEAKQLPSAFMQKYLNGKGSLDRKIAPCPKGGFELRLDNVS